MPALPTIPTFTSDTLPTSKLNELAAATRFLMRPPIVKLRQTVAQTLTTGVNTAITFTTESVDDDVDGGGAHDNVTNTSRFTARYPGWYAAAGKVSFNGNATGIRMARFQINGTADDASDILLATAGAGNTHRGPAATILEYLNVDDYLEMYAVQTSGGNLATIVTTGGEQSYMNVWFVSKGA